MSQTYESLWSVFKVYSVFEVIAMQTYVFGAKGFHEIPLLRNKKFIWNYVNEI